MYKKVCEKISLNLFIYFEVLFYVAVAMAMASILGHSLSPFYLPVHTGKLFVYSYMYTSTYYVQKMYIWCDCLIQNLKLDVYLYWIKHDDKISATLATCDGIYMYMCTTLTYRVFAYIHLSVIPRDKYYLGYMSCMLFASPHHFSRARAVSGILVFWVYVCEYSKK